MSQKSRYFAPKSSGIEKASPKNTGRAWWLVILGGLLEIVWATGFKYPIIPTFVVIIAIIISFDLILRAASLLPVSTVYAVFTGIGTLGTTAVDAGISGTVTFPKLLLILLLLLFIIGLKLSGEERTN